VWGELRGKSGPWSWEDFAGTAVVFGGLSLMTNSILLVGLYDGTAGSGICLLLPIL
jgi:hypothetical protein